MLITSKNCFFFSFSEISIEEWHQRNCWAINYVTEDHWTTKHLRLVSFFSWPIDSYVRYLITCGDMIPCQFNQRCPCDGLVNNIVLVSCMYDTPSKWQYLWLILLTNPKTIVRLGLINYGLVFFHTLEFKKSWSLTVWF